jgi:hypothetical protein
MNKFNAQFRKSAVAVAEAIGLEFISTKRQVENGTLVFNDAKTNTQYAMYESGYVRRGVNGCWNRFSGSTASLRWYQLNRTERYHGRTARILAGPCEQLGILVKSVVNWREKSKPKKLSRKEIHSTSWHGTTLMASRKTLCDLLGQPHSFGDVDDKVQYEWFLETSTGVPYTIYDWKEYRELSEYETVEWHIGGYSREDTILAVKDLRFALAY